MRSSRLTVERSGAITLPAEVREAVRLRPGDILAIKPGEGFFDLEIYRELLAAWEHMGHGILMGFVIELLSHPPSLPNGQPPLPEAWTFYPASRRSYPTGRGVYPCKNLRV